uniref:Uncharacterized protein n=1 Tax=Arundo donax TaxID=35708 RepID=A0A0A8YB52_ARUDO
MSWSYPRPRKPPNPAEAVPNSPRTLTNLFERKKNVNGGIRSFD